MGDVRLELLGPARVVRAGAAVPGIGRKSIGLLAYLAAPAGRFHNRDELVNLLWSDRFDEQARQSLRQTLSTLRKAIGEALLTDDRGVALAQDMVVTDVDEFAAAAASGALEDLRRARSLYRGAFLEGGPSVSAAFDDWAQQERRRLRDLHINALEAIARREFEAGDKDEALASARRLVAEEPAHEGGHRLIMQILALQGQRTAALRQYEACKGALRRHLDAAPEAETVELAERIRASPPAPGEARAPAAIQPRLLWRAVRRRPLRRAIVIAVAAIALLGAAGGYLALRPFFAPAISGAERSTCTPSARVAAFVRPAVVVLPLDASGARGEAALFADALTDRISAMFNTIPGLSVVTGPPRGHADLGKTRRDLASELGVTHVLDGVVRNDGGQVTALVRLIDGSTGQLMWSFLRSYNLTHANRLAVQNEIALEVARAAQLQLTEGDQALHFHAYETASLDVLEHVFAGSIHLNRLTRGDNRRARAEFEAARALDPRDPPANVGLAWTYAADAFFGWSETPQQDVARAERYANAAIQTDRDYFYSYTVLGLTALLKGDHARAVAHGEKAMEMSGSGADAVALHALTLTYTGDVQRSLELAQRALRLRPYNYPDWYEWILARAQRLNGAPGAAIACLAPTRLQDSGALMALVERALALAETGDVAQARRLAAAARRQAGPRLTAENYCAHPPYATRALTQRCVSDLRGAGFPLR